MRADGCREKGSTMANSVNGFRFTNGYEDVFSYTTDYDGAYTYVCADPWAWGHSFTATDYKPNGDGTYSAGSSYPVSIDQLVNEWIPGYAAPMDVAATIIGAEFARAWAMDAQEYDDDEPLDAMGLLDVAACHVLDTAGAPDPFPTLPGESWHDYYTRWEKALTASGIEFDA